VFAEDTRDATVLTLSWFPLQNADPAESEKCLFQLPHQLRQSQPVPVQHT